MEDHHSLLAIHDSLLATHYSPLPTGRCGRSCAGPGRKVRTLEQSPRSSISRRRCCRTSGGCARLKPPSPPDTCPCRQIPVRATGWHPVPSPPDCRKPTRERTVRASPAGWPVQNPQPGIPSMRLFAINESHDRGTLPSVGQGRPGGRVVRWRIMDSRRSQQTGSCRRRIYVLESGRRRQEKSGFRSRLQICREDTGNTAHIVLRSWVLKRTP